MRGDRRHLHHFLLSGGISPQTATAILIAACFVLGAMGLIGWQLGVPDHVMLVGLIAPFMLHAYVVFYGWKAIGQRYGIPGAESAAATNALQAAGH
jgi:UDP-GlcNAc:undecaprenyl-phosphate GlcNAc-1-phosphate transferase